MQQEVVLAMLAKEPSHGYELRARLADDLGPLGETMNAGQIYVTLARLEKARLVTCDRAPGQPNAPDRKTYRLTAAGHERLASWLREVTWPKPDLAEFHLKLAVAGNAKLADPLEMIDQQRREIFRLLRDTQRAQMGAIDGSSAALLLEGYALRLQADLRWLEAWERAWNLRKEIE